MKKPRALLTFGRGDSPTGRDDLTAALAAWYAEHPPRGWGSV